MQKVLFVCVGNSCRSQMAEGLAKAHGADVAMVMSAGLYPAASVSSLTREVMAERNIDLSEHYPKGVSEVPWDDFDLIVNMSGHMLPHDTKARVLHWEVADPIGATREVYQEVLQQIEDLVEDLLTELRPPPAGSSGNGPSKPKRRRWFGI